MSSMPASRTSPITSKIILDQAVFASALTAAGKIAGTKAPYDVIQIRLLPATEEIVVCAVNPKATLNATIQTHMFDLIGDRDEIIEIEKPRAKGLTSMKFGKATGDEDIRAGLIISENYLELTDETGLGMHINKTRIPRLTQRILEGDPIKTITRAKSLSDRGHHVMPYPAQTDAIAQVQKTLGHRARIRQLDIGVQEKEASRILATGPWWALTVTALPVHPEEEKDDTPGLRVVGTNPPRGLA